MLKSSTSLKQKKLITMDILHKYIKHPKFWLVVDNQDKPVGLFNNFMDAYYKRSNKLIVLETFKTNRRHLMAVVRCFCGNKFTARYSDIKREHTKSCGCLRKKI